MHTLNYKIFSNRKTKCPRLKNLHGSNNIENSHYIINTKRVITSSEVCTALKEYLPKDTFYVKRIRKPLFKYTRVSIKKKALASLSKADIECICNRLNIRLKRQSLKRNLALENQPTRRSKCASIMTLNINGMSFKIEELYMLLNRYKPDIVCMQETKRSEYCKRLYLIGYTIFELPAGSSGLGLLIATRNKSKLDINILDTNIDCIIASIKGEGMRLNVVNIYRSHDAERRKATMKKVLDHLKGSPDQDTVIVGDWNATPDMMLKSISSKGVRIFGFDAPKKGTRISKRRRRSRKALDYGLCNKPDLIKAQSVKTSWRLSDHFPVLVTLNCTIKSAKNQQKTVFDRRRLFTGSIQESLKTLSVDTTDSNIQTYLTEFHSRLVSKLTELKVIKTITMNPGKAFVTNAVKKAIVAKRQIDRLVSKKQAALEDLLIARKNMKTAISLAKRKAYLRHIRKGVYYLKSNDSKNAWKWIKCHSGMMANRKICNGIYSKTTGTVITDPVKVLSIWTEHFKSLSTNTTTAPNDIELDVQMIENGNKFAYITDTPIRWSELASTLKSLRNGKATGEDGIPCEIYKIVANEPAPNSSLARCLLKLLNGVFLKNTFPNEWNNSIVVPIFKKGDRYDPNNYRGISLINTLLKVLTKILATRLQIVCNDLGVLRREQSGFLTGEECVAQAACLVEVCQRRKIRGKDTFLCFLDLKKAYDMVPHNMLLSTLRQVGLGDIFIKFIERMYNNTYLKMRIGNLLGQSFKYERGVRQGCPISPLLFNIYYNSVLDHINPISVEGLTGGIAGLMFADDTVLLAESRMDLILKLDIIKQWMSKYQMEINPSKCGIIVVSENDNIEHNDPIIYDMDIIPMVEEYTYLGIQINKDLNLDTMARHRLSKGRETLEIMRKTLSNDTVPLEYKRMLISSILVPRMNFGSEIFGMSLKRSDPMKRILDNAIKCIIKKSNYCRLRAYNELDILPIYVQGAVSRTRGMHKWNNSRGLIKELLATNAMFKSRKRTWIKEANRWLKCMKLDYTQDTRYAVKRIRLSRMSHLSDKDKSIIGSLATKHNINSGKFLRKKELSSYLPQIGVNALLRLRTGTFSFSRYLAKIGKIDFDYTFKCVCCKETVTEDTWHLMMECHAFTDVREETFMQNRWGLRGRADLTEENTLGALLGGEQVASRNKKLLPGLVFEAVKYLARVVPRRLGFISRCINGPVISQ